MWAGACIGLGEVVASQAMGSPRALGPRRPVGRRMPCDRANCVGHCVGAGHEQGCRRTSWGSAHARGSAQATCSAQAIECAQTMGMAQALWSAQLLGSAQANTRHHVGTCCEVVGAGHRCSADMLRGRAGAGCARACARSAAHPSSRTSWAASWAPYSCSGGYPLRLPERRRARWGAPWEVGRSMDGPELGSGPLRRSMGGGFLGGSARSSGGWRFRRQHASSM